LKNRLFLIVLLFQFVSIACNPFPKRIWKTVYSSNSKSDIIGMNFVSHTHGFALTLWELMETRNGGKTWSTRAKLLYNKYPMCIFQSLAFWDIHNMWIMGTQRSEPHAKSNGLIWITSDSGKNWKKILNPNVTNVISARFCSQKIGWIVGEIHPTEFESRDSCILRTNDGGLTWTEQNRSYGANKHIEKIDCFDCNEALALRSDNVILHTKDGGISWAQQALPAAWPLYNIRIFGNEAWVVGAEGTVFRSTDRGMTWKHVFIENTDMCDVLMLGKRGWIASVKGIFSSMDGGNGWNYEKSATSNWIKILCSWDSSIWAGGDPFIILRHDLK
jgi:photosystem II stability/assembly factor-like uncharacterized protein